MPSVILIDNSLSMLQCIVKGSADTYASFVNHLLDSIFLEVSSTNFMEYVATVIDPGQSTRQLSEFTRSYPELKSRLHQGAQAGQSVDFVCTMHFVIKEFVKFWGPNVTPNYIIITDGGPIREFPRLTDLKTHETSKEELLSEGIPGVLTVLSLTDRVCPDLSWLVDRAESGSVQLSPLTGSMVADLAATMCRLKASALRSSYAKLTCGHLTSHVQLHPPLHLSMEQVPKHQENGATKNGVESNFLSVDIIGFLRIADVHSAPTDTRHLVLPVRYDPDSGCSAALKDEDYNTSNLTLLLHGALKVNKMVALATLRTASPSTQSDDITVRGGGVASGLTTSVPDTKDTNPPKQYALLYSLTDQRKANLVVAFFKQGVTSLSWLGHFSHLAPISDYATPLYNDAEGKSPFPVRVPTRLSYWTSPNDGGGNTPLPDVAESMGPSYPHTSWISPSVLTADVQKVVRMSRRIGDRQQIFFKEVNRVRSAALAFGFPQVLTSLAQLLEREMTTLTNTAGIFQLQHVIGQLKSANQVAEPIKPAQAPRIKSECV